MLFDSSKESSKAVKNGPGGVLKTEIYGRMPCGACQKSQKSVERAVTHIIVQDNDQYLEKDKRTLRDLTLKDSHSSDKLFIAGMDHEPANEINFILMVQTESLSIFAIKLQGNRS